tara:strand:+ start:424 stop:942 length:519 start_codon:yes stop_codon:yes gene_type:complete
MIYNPTLSRKQLESKFSKLRKLKYNQFRWWRMYDNPNKSLDTRSPLRDRILNGDFDFSHYWYQASWVEHDINDLQIECKDDSGLFVEKGAVLRARRKRLLEDFERDEKEKLEGLYNDFPKYFRIFKSQVKEEIANFSGSLIDFYYHMDDKYKIIHKPYPYGKNKRGRPRKTS